MTVTSLRRGSRRARFALAAAGILATATALVGVAPPAHAASIFDGVFTLDHGASGQFTFNTDGTYTSTCQSIPNFPAINCPTATGTFSRDYTSVYMNMTGTDGRVMGFRFTTTNGVVTLLNGGGGSGGGTYSGLSLHRGTTFKCLSFYDSTYTFAKGPLVYTDKSGNKGFALGSNQAVGAINAGNYVTLSERSIGYFVKGSC